MAQICRKIWGGQGHSGQAIKLEADRNWFLFSAPKMGCLVIFGFSRFRPKMNVNFCFIFPFRSKRSFSLGRKRYFRNQTVTKFCERHRWLSFTFTAENERCIFGLLLQQSVSDYTLRQWFSNTQQSRFQKACRCLEKIVLPSIFNTQVLHPSSSSSSSSSSRSPSEPLRLSVTPGDLRSQRRLQ